MTSLFEKCRAFFFDTLPEGAVWKMMIGAAAAIIVGFGIAFLSLYLVHSRTEHMSRISRDSLQGLAAINDLNFKLKALSSKKKNVFELREELSRSIEACSVVLKRVTASTISISPDSDISRTQIRNLWLTLSDELGKALIYLENASGIEDQREIAIYGIDIFIDRFDHTKEGAIGNAQLFAELRDYKKQIAIIEYTADIFLKQFQHFSDSIDETHGEYLKTSQRISLTIFAVVTIFTIVFFTFFSGILTRKLRYLIKEINEQNRELGESEEKYRELVQNANSIILRMDTEGRLLFFNEYAQRLFGYTEEEILGRNVVGTIVAERAPAGRNLRAMTCDGCNRPEDFVLNENENVTRDGETVWVSWTNSPLLDETGAVAAFLCVGTDITERKRGEEELRQANLVVENSPAVLFRWKAADNWPILMVSRNISQFGYLQEDLLSGTVTYSDLVHPDDMVRMNSEMEYYSSNNIDRYRQEYRVLTGGGEVRWVDDRTTVIRGADGQVVEHQGIVLDITERKQTEQQLQRQTSLFQNLFKSSPEAIAVLDHEDRVLEINRSFETLFGFCQAEARGQGINDLIAPDPYRGDAQSVSERVVREGHVVEKEAIRCAKDGRPVDVSLIGYPLVEDQQQIGAFAIYRDITEYKKMQELMIQTEKMVSVGGIAAGIAHEINNPLGIVLQAAQNLAMRMRPDFPKNQEVARTLGLDMNVMGQYAQARKLDVFLQDIQSAAKRAATIIRQMLDFTRRSESRRILCSPSQIVRNALVLVQSDYDLKKNYDFKRIQVDFVEEEGLPLILCTETEIEQVVLNVLRNAAQAMADANPSRDNPRIDVRIFSVAGSVRMEFADNGPGIPADTLARVFEPFFTTKEPGKGTGLGLSVSYFIITQGHGGSMFAESTPGEGTRFIIELPVSEGAS